MPDNPHPEYYGGFAAVYEVIKVIDAWGLGFKLGNAVKYIARAGKKPGSSAIDDLKKAKHYLELEIEQLEAQASAKTEILRRMASVHSVSTGPIPVDLAKQLGQGANPVRAGIRTETTGFVPFSPTIQQDK